MRQGKTIEELQVELSHLQSEIAKFESPTAMRTETPSEPKELKVLKNHTKETIVQSFRGRNITFKKKASQIFDMFNERERSLYLFWLGRFGPPAGGGIITDITSRFPELNSPNDEAKNTEN